MDRWKLKPKYPIFPTAREMSIIHIEELDFLSGTLQVFHKCVLTSFTGKTYTQCLACIVVGAILRTMMKRLVYTAGLLGVFILSSCKSLSKLTSRDNSTASTQGGKNSQPQQREFLSQIEVTPGAAVVSRHTSTMNDASTGMSGGLSTSAVNRSHSGPSELGAFNIERAGYLQLKYAVMTDATVEKMTNIPLLEVIDKWWGTKYCYGGSTENCIDCSAFTQVLMRDVYKTQLPRTSKEQFDKSERIELADLREGDLVFFHTTGRRKSAITHVGIYLHNNKFVHAATSGGVMISDLNDKYWQPRFRGAGRVII